MDLAEITRLLAQQSGVVSRRQVIAASGRDADLERLVRRREWARVHPGIFVEHTGPLSWKQQAWAGVLLHWPAALAGTSALAAHGLAERSTTAVLELVVDRSRRVDDPPGLRTTQVRGFDDVALMNLSPPRVRVEHAVLTAAATARADDAAVALLADAVQQGRTTPERIREAIADRPRLRRRALLREVAADVADGAYSALERRYLRDVERAHRLPTGTRQVRSVGPMRGVVAYRDVLYDEQRTAVELDGRLGHEEAADVWDDLDRDLDAATDGLLTLRVGWRHVLSPCRLAASVGAVLAARGWDGSSAPCSGCDDGRGSSAPGAGDPRPSAA